MYYIYIAFNKEIDKYYIGYTSSIKNRLMDHNTKGHKVKFTRKQTGVWILKYSESYNTRSEAIRREKEIKGWKSRKMIEKLIG